MQKIIASIAKTKSLNQISQKILLITILKSLRIQMME